MKFWKNWPYWFGEKLKKIDIVVVVVLSLFLAVIPFFVVFTAPFYAVEQTSSLMQFTNVVLSMPVVIIGYTLHFTGFDAGDSEGLGSFIWGMFFSPILAFIIWFCIFYVFTKISDRFFKGKYAFFKHGTSILVVAFLISPYAYYSFGTNEINACLSGKLDYTFHPGQLGGVQLPDAQQGPVDCFKSIVEKGLGSKVNDPTAIANYCNNLSDTKLVDNGKNGLNLSYRNFCKNNLQYQNKSSQ